MLSHSECKNVDGRVCISVETGSNSGASGFAELWGGHLTYTDPAKQANSAMLWPDGASSTDLRNLINWTIARGTTVGMNSGYIPNPGTYACVSTAATAPGRVMPVARANYNTAIPVLNCPTTPPENGDFGNFKVTLQVKQGPTATFQPSEVAYIQTFFSRDGTDHSLALPNDPNASFDSQGSPREDLLSQGDGSWYYSTGPTSTPNWYHYYTQVYPPGTAGANGPAGPDFWPSMSYTGGAGSSTDGYKMTNPNTGSTPVYNIHIGGLYEGPPTPTTTQLASFPVFTLDTSNPNALVQYAGDIALRGGIMNYIYIASHEYGHQHAFSSKDAQGNSVSNVDSNGVAQRTYYKYDDPINKIDQEYDNLSAVWKGLHHLNPGSSDTTGAYPNYSPWQDGTDKPDNELVADIEALGMLFKNKALWMQDWASDGVQCYTDSQNNIVRPPSDLMALVPGANPPNYDFGFKYTPVGGATRDVFQLSDIQNAVDPSGSGKIKVLQSLEDF